MGFHICEGHSETPCRMTWDDLGIKVTGNTLPPTLLPRPFFSVCVVAGQGFLSSVCADVLVCTCQKSEKLSLQWPLAATFLSEANKGFSCFI